MIQFVCDIKLYYIKGTIKKKRKNEKIELLEEIELPERIKLLERIGLPERIELPEKNRATRKNRATQKNRATRNIRATLIRSGPGSARKIELLKVPPGSHFNLPEYFEYPNSSTIHKLHRTLNIPLMSDYLININTSFTKAYLITLTRY